MGRTASNIIASRVAEITPEDLESIDKSPVEKGGAGGLLQIRAMHHKIALLFSLGHKVIEIGAMTGYSVGYISQLQGDPAFENLLAHYKDKAALLHADVMGMLQSLNTDALSVVHERLVEDPEKFTVSDLLKIVEATSDRTGYGPSSTVNHRHTGLTDERILALKEKAEQRQTGRVTTIEFGPEPTRSEKSEGSSEQTSDETGKAHENSSPERGGASSFWDADVEDADFIVGETEGDSSSGGWSETGSQDAGDSEEGNS